MNRAMDETVERRAIHVAGVVQGVGFRPFAYRLARDLGLAGWIRNATDGVDLEIQGPAERLERFLDSLLRQHPPGAVVRNVTRHRIAPCEERTFIIGGSARAGRRIPSIPPDLAVCAECMAEVRARRGRRRGYAFTSCSSCGPRYSIIERLPYDRPGTSMACFAMCAQCAREYGDPGDRRFHAQPIACPACGPTLELLTPNGEEVARGNDALGAAVRAVAAGRVLALQGLGGYQLVVDATSEAAVAALRARKRRPDKPLAIMCASLAAVREMCSLSRAEAEILAGPEAPIVLLDRVAHGGGTPDGRGASDVVEGVAPANPRLGVMLPPTPLHHLIVSALGKPIVCTSGNLSEEPMAISTADALVGLRTIADLLLAHDRPIVRPLDDSIVRIDADGPRLLRRARGYAPLSLPIASDGATILAVGGHLKNTVALGLGREAVLSQHHGDLGSPRSRAAFEASIADLLRFYEATPEAVACDLHPDYASTQSAERLAAHWNVPLVRVQHHHAHIAACVAEHALKGPVLGFAWDGTGHGGDGTVWGGEALVCDDNVYRRVAHIRPFRLIGGERAAREPRRAGLAVAHEIFGAHALEYVRMWFPSTAAATMCAMLERDVHSPPTTSVGRLFDAVAALLGLRGQATFEGQAAMELEFALDETASAEDADVVRIVEPGTPATGVPAPLVGDWEPLIRGLLVGRDRGDTVGVLSRRFHDALAGFALAVAERIGLRQIVLAGGCFQNAHLARGLRARLQAAGFRVYTPQRVPTNDGGISLGQLLVARATLASRGTRRAAPGGT